MFKPDDNSNRAGNKIARFLPSQFLSSFPIFLFESTWIYKPLCRSVRRSVVECSEHATYGESSSSWQKFLHLNVVFLYHAVASLSRLFLYFSRLVFIFVLNRFAVTNSLCIARFMQGKARIHAKRNDRIFKFLRVKRELWNEVKICISKIMHLAQCNFAKDLCACFFSFLNFLCKPGFLCKYCPVTNWKLSFFERLYFLHFYIDFNL